MRIRTIVGILMLMLLAATSMTFAGTSANTNYPPPPNFAVSSNSTTVCRGQVNYVPITVWNNGEPGSINPSELNSYGPAMINVELSAQNTKNTYFAWNSTAVMGTVNPLSSNTAYLAWFVPQNASATDTLGIGINYFYYTYAEDQEERNLSFSAVQCKLPLTLNVSPAILTSGEIQTIGVGLHNSGQATLRDISVSVYSPTSDMSQLTQMPLNLVELAPGASATINDTVFVDKNASLSFPLNITADFYSGGQFMQAASYKQTLSQGLINISASSVTVSPSPVTPGGIFSISFVLTDTGTSGASTVIVSSQESNSFRLYGSSSEFVGSIAAEAQAPVTLTFQADNLTKPGTYQIPVRVSYLDNFRNNDNSTIIVPVTVVAAGAALSGAQTGSGAAVRTSGGSGLLVISALVIMAVVLGYVYYRERKKGHRK